nr:PREDICTED: protein FRA10AC1 isoform X2 [Megachile rotundata]
MFPAYAYLSAYDRHKKLINDYLTLHDDSISSLKRDTSRDKTDYDVIRENHKFLWDQDNDEPDTWGAKLAKKYYDKLFKEYCIADLTYYKQNKVALRWRTEKEVIVGKGQFECGNKKCNEKEELKSWEVNFGYIEHDQKKNALVKLTKRHKALKRLGTNSDVQNTASDMPSTSVENVKTEDKAADKITEPVEEMNKNESNIWKEKPADNLEKTREEEFEEYLADLLM